MNVFMNGRVIADLSDWTSAIAKLTVANEYGQKNYSIKAFPSPKLTAAEQEIVFRCAQKAGYDPRRGDSSTEINTYADNQSNRVKYIYEEGEHDTEGDKVVAENRYKLMDNYYHRNQPTIKLRDLAPYFDYDKEHYESVSIILDDLSLEDELLSAKILGNLNTNGQQMRFMRDVTIYYRDKYQQYELNQTESVKVKLFCQVEKRPEGFIGLWAYLTADYSDTDLISSLNSLFRYYPELGESPTYQSGDEFLLSHLPYFLFPHYLEVAIHDLCWCDLKDKQYKAMPKEVIDFIINEIDSIQKIGRIDNDLYESQAIDRLEKCVVLDKQFKIDLYEQKENLRKRYEDVKETYTIYYDIKTMQPFIDSELDLDITNQKCVRVTTSETLNEDVIFAAIQRAYAKYELTKDDYIIINTIGDFSLNGSNPNFSLYDGDLTDTYLVYFKITKRKYLTLKRGTQYLKWTRTVDEDINDLTYIGSDLSIDIDTFPGEFMIVGETYIREQQTGQDRRYQLVLNRATLSPSTNIKLEAKGDPTTFSIDVNVLLPYDKKSMIELRQYNVEEDKFQGGFKIVPQNKHHVYTKPVETIDEIIVPNNEIY